MHKLPVLITSLFLFLITGCTPITSTPTAIIPTAITTPKLKAIDCSPEERNVDACIEIYQPVCGQVQVECIQSPCDPVKEIFSNSCKA